MIFNAHSHLTHPDAVSEFYADAMLNEFSKGMNIPKEILLQSRILKAIVTLSDVGNLTTIADPSVVETLLEERKKMDIEIG